MLSSTLVTSSRKHPRDDIDAYQHLALSFSCGQYPIPRGELKTKKLMHESGRSSTPILLIEWLGTRIPDNAVCLANSGFFLLASAF